MIFSWPLTFHPLKILVITSMEKTLPPSNDPPAISPGCCCHTQGGLPFTRDEVATAIRGIRTSAPNQISTWKWIPMTDPHGTIAYLPTFTIWKHYENVGEYTIPMDPMG